MKESPFLASLRLGDSFLPVGTDSISYALETFIQNNRIKNIDDLQKLLETYLRRQIGRSDLVALRAAHKAATEDDLGGIQSADCRLKAVTLAAEFRESSTRTGKRLLILQQNLSDDDLLTEYFDAVETNETPGNYAVVLGVVAASEGIDSHDACLLLCHGFVTDMLAVAQRLMQLSHTDAQQALTELRPAMADAVKDSADRSVEEMVSFTPLINILSAEHERADRRLFIS
jgi:urease accessory protein